MSPEARFNALFEEHYGAVARYVRTRGHGPADADDAPSEREAEWVEQAFASEAERVATR